MRYRVDLKRFMAECEANYQRLVKLFPDMENLDHYRFGISGGRHISLRVIKRAPYTSLLEISEEAAGDRDVDKTAWLSAPTMEVRLYHDARLAEVVSCEAVHRINPRYRYPNRKMHQPDEKAQWNRFLSEWLASCLERGYAVLSPIAFVDEEP